MSFLKSKEFQDSYSKSFAELLGEFYIPVLERSVRYDRATGFFSSAIFLAIEAALSGFIARGGKIRMICSPRLSIDDKDAILRGLSDREIESKLVQEIDEFDFIFGSKAPSSILRSLIARKVLEIKIAVMRNGNGMYHDKYGMFHDEQDDFLCFDGSINESIAGWSAYGNHERFQVFRSWIEGDRSRAQEIRVEFQYAWDDLSNSFRVVSADRLPEVFKLRGDEIPENDALERFRNARLLHATRTTSNGVLVNKPLDLQKHQKLALANWSKQNHQGIISFVTAGGKTITALSAVREWLREQKPVIILVPSQILLDQWITEVQRELSIATYKLVQVGAGVGPENWRERVRNYLDEDLKQPPALIIGTYDSARTEPFLFLAERRRQDILLVCDEVHVVGAKENRKILSRITAIRRLGLSATPERYRDTEGTKAIFDFFGATVEPVFGISEGIAAGRLVPYSYNIRSVQLTEFEWKRFEELTVKIRQVARLKDETSGSNSYLDQLLQQRANVVKNATGKVGIALAIVEPKLNLYSHWLLYCNSLAQIREIREHFSGQGIECLEYHSRLTPTQRSSVIDYFTSNGGILAAVHCLDQGVDIPRIDAAVILASSTNPREYIQRRGRILRFTPNKLFADLNDVLAVKPDGTVALKSDISRAREIGANARNRDQVMIDIDFLAGSLDDNLSDGMELVDGE